MKNAVIFHGSPSRAQHYDPDFPSASNYYWLPWLQKQLAINNIPADVPEVPNAWHPHYPTWKDTFERCRITPDTLLVGHSCGAGFLVRWLSENQGVRVNKVFLVAPWIDPTDPPSDADDQVVADVEDFFNFSIDSDLSDKTAGVTIVNSDDDMATIQRSVKKLRQEIKDINYMELSGYGHFYDDNRLVFPELLQEILR